jgi:hypothetical protein
MIYRAAKMAQERNYTGYNIDWENQPGNATSKVLLVFLSAGVDWEQSFLFSNALPGFGQVSWSVPRRTSLSGEDPFHRHLHKLGSGCYAAM